MEIRCPRCESTVQVEVGSKLSDICCTACGDTFNILEDPTLEHEGDSTKRVGHFELVSQIGAGSYGAVWKARDLELDRTVAVKIPRRGVMGSGGPEAFVREAQAAAQLQHPNIVTVHEIGRDDDSLFIVSDFIDGLPLSDWLSDGRTASPREAASWIIKLSRALQHAHEMGIVHRDLKPSNIMLDRNNEPYVMDFGLAKRDVADMTVTVDGMVLGTPAYMSPEQARGEGNRADHRSDIYSLGVILFQLLTGERPFRGSARMIMHQVIHDPPPQPKKLNGSVPADMNTICLKCMEKSPAQRFGSAQELVEELERFLRGEPILSRPVGATTRVWRWCQRNPVVATLACLLIVALSVGVAGIGWQSIRANTNAQRATFEAARARGAAERERDAHRDTSRYLYVAHMNMVQQAFEMSDPARAVAILNRQRQSGETSPGFEWYYWWRQCHRWRSHFLGHEQAVHCTAYSPDGRHLASGGLDHRVILWDAATGEITHEWRHDARVFSVAFSPDNKTLASGGYDKKVRLWDVESGQPIRSIEGHRNSVFSLTFAHDGKTLITGSGDHTIGVWNVENGERVATLGGEDGHIDFIYNIALDHSGKHLASASLDRTVKIWDLASGELKHTLSGHELEVWCVDFSMDDAYVASGSGDGTIRVWDVATGKLTTLMRGHTDRVRSLRFLPRGNILVSGGQDRRVVLWDVKDLRPDEPEEIVRQPNRRGNFFFERQDFRDQKRLLASLQGHSGSVNGVAISSDGGWLATASEDRTVKRWDVAECLEPSVLMGHTGSVNAVAIDSEGKLLLSGGNDRTARLWDLSTGLPIGEPLPHAAFIYTVAFSDDGQLFATGGRDSLVSIYRRNSAQPIRVLKGHKGSVSCLTFARNGLLYSGSHDETVKAWNVDTGQCVATYSGHSARVTAVQISPDEKRLASASLDQTVRVWELEESGDARTLTHPTSVYSLAFSPDGRTLVTGGKQSLRFWNLSSGELSRIVRAHANLINSLAYSPDGRTLASGGGDKVIKIWDVETGEPKTTLRGHGHRVWSLAFTPDGRTLASSSYKLHLWRGASNRSVEGRVDKYDEEAAGDSEASAAP